MRHSHRKNKRRVTRNRHSSKQEGRKSKHPTLHSWPRTEQHTLCRKSSPARLTKRRTKRGVTDNQEPTDSSTTGPLASKKHMRRYRCVRFEEIQQVCNSVIRNCVCVCSVCMCVVCVCTNTFFHIRFLDLSLISRFPISTLFAPFSILDCVAGKLNKI